MARAESCDPRKSLRRGRSLTSESRLCLVFPPPCLRIQALSPPPPLFTTRHEAIFGPLLQVFKKFNEKFHPAGTQITVVFLIRKNVEWRRDQREGRPQWRPERDKNVLKMQNCRERQRELDTVGSSHLLLQGLENEKKKKKRKKRTLIRHIVFCAFCLFSFFFFRCPPVMGAILRDEPLCSGAPTEWPIVGARWAQDRRRRGDGVGEDGLRQERRQRRRRRNRGGTDATKGINECGFKRLAGTREAVWAE